MSRPGRSPGLTHRGALAGVAAGALAAALLAGTGALGTLPGSQSGAGASTTTTTEPWVPGLNGTITVGIDQAPTGCNPNTASGDTWANRLLLEPVLPSAFNVNGNGQPTYNAALITQAELQSTSPETVVYTINPKAVWSDGKPVTAADFIYTWHQERGSGGSVGTSAKNATTSTTSTTTAAAPSTPPAARTGTATTTAGSSPTPATSPTPPGAATPPAAAPVTTLPGATGTTGPAVGYRQIKSIRANAKAGTMTVVFKTPYADWQSLFSDLLPAHVLRHTGWDPRCTTLDPSIDLSAGPFVIAKVLPGQEVVLKRNPRWWEQAPALSKIVVRVATGPAELSRWLARGTIDVALPHGYSAQYLEAVSSQPGLSTQSEQSTTFLQLELSTTSVLTASANVRLAIAHAVDRQALVNDAVGWADSTIVPAQSHLFAQPQNGYPGHRPPPLQVSGQPGYTATTAGSASKTATPFPVTADLAETSRLLTALGAFRGTGGTWHLPTGRLLALRMAVDDADPWSARAAADLVRQLGAAGFPVTLVHASSAQAAGVDLASGAADLCLLPMHASPYPSQAVAWYSPLLGAPGTGGSQDWTNLDDPTVNALLEKASEQLNPVDAAPVYAQVDTLLWQDMAALPLFVQPSVLAWSGLTSGVSPNPNGPSLFWALQNWAIRVPPTSPDTQP